MKPNLERLTLANYPVSLDVPVRFADLDPLRHINNVAFGQFYEEARVHLNTQVFAMAQSRPERMLVANVDIAYLHEGLYPGVIRVGSGIGKIGRTSYEIVQALFQSGRCIGAAQTIVVYILNGMPAPPPPQTLAALEHHLFRAIPSEA